MARIALVLGAGGAVGQAYHAGVLKALAEMTGYDPRTADVVVGTSAGSVVAASLRAGIAAADLYARATGRPLSPEAQALLARVAAPAVSGGNSAAGGLLPARRTGPSSPQLLGRLLSRPFAVRPGVAFSALLPEGRRDTSGWFVGFDGAFEGGRWPSRPMLICAVDLDRGTRVVFGSPGAPPATVAQAVHASCSIPAVFRPALIDGVRYVDGGAHSPTNADLVADAERPFDAVVISSPMTADLGSTPSGRASTGSSGDDSPDWSDRALGWPIAGIRMATRLPAARMLARERRALVSSGIPTLVFEPTADVLDAMGLQPMDFRRRGPVAEAGYQSARALLDGPGAVEVGAILVSAGRG